jgi:hypothetical protein
VCESLPRTILKGEKMFKVRNKNKEAELEVWDVIQKNYEVYFLIFDSFSQEWYVSPANNYMPFYRS